MKNYNSFLRGFNTFSNDFNKVAKAFITNLISNEADRSIRSYLREWIYLSPKIPIWYTKKDFSSNLVLDEKIAWAFKELMLKYADWKLKPKDFQIVLKDEKIIKTKQQQPLFDFKYIFQDEYLNAQAWKQTYNNNLYPWSYEPIFRDKQLEKIIQQATKDKLYKTHTSNNEIFKYTTLKCWVCGSWMTQYIQKIPWTKRVFLVNNLRCSNKRNNCENTATNFYKVFYDKFLYPEVKKLSLYSWQILKIINSYNSVVKDLLKNRKEILIELNKELETSIFKANTINVHDKIKNFKNDYIKLNILIDIFSRSPSDIKSFFDNWQNILLDLLSRPQEYSDLNDYKDFVIFLAGGDIITFNSISNIFWNSTL